MKHYSYNFVALVINVWYFLNKSYNIEVTHVPQPNELL